MDADADPSENEPDKKAKQDSRSEEAENIGKKTAGRKEVCKKSAAQDAKAGQEVTEKGKEKGKGDEQANREDSEAEDKPAGTEKEHEEKKVTGTKEEGRTKKAKKRRKEDDSDHSSTGEVAEGEKHTQEREGSKETNKGNSKKSSTEHATEQVAEGEKHTQGREGSKETNKGNSKKSSTEHATEEMAEGQKCAQEREEREGREETDNENSQESGEDATEGVAEGETHAQEREVHRSGLIERTDIFGQPIEEIYYDITTEEARILGALSDIWLRNIGHFCKPPASLSEKEQLFYDTYCSNKESLKSEVKRRLLRLPHVIAVFLKRTRAQIEVVVTNCEEALDASPELREEHFDVVNFVGMHLM